nr:hypothetical protein [Bacillota bacterium]
MTQQIMRDLFCVQKRFLRSANLERDFRDTSAFDGYVLTDEVRSHVSRLASGLAPQSGQRAWRITGDYGSGKSSFALLLAHLFSDRFSQLPGALQSAVSLADAKKPNLLPVLVTGSRSGLSDALLLSLETALRSLSGRAPRSVAREIATLLACQHEDLPDQVVIRVVQRACNLVVEHKFADGLLIIIDELGRFLEFAALRPERQDVGVLQSLAEAACRSGERPLFVIGLLHQGFSAYAEHLSQSAQREWEKIAGRFEELVFAQPLDQIAGLIADATSLKMDMMAPERVSAAERHMGQTLRLGWYGAAPASHALTKLSARIFPLHPTVIPALVRFFRRFGQNERSLFSFLLSNEEFALLDFCSRPLEESRYYRLHDLYDYIRSAFGHRLAAQSYRSHWSHIDSTVQSFTDGDALELQILKTVGLLNLLDQAPLLATMEAIVACVADKASSAKKVEAAVIRLAEKRRVLYRRGGPSGYCLWPFTSVNLDRAYEDANQALGPIDRVAPMVKDYLHERPLVARRHYIETGNLRHFRVVYSGLADVQQLLESHCTDSDGLILVPLSENRQEHRKALDFASSATLAEKPEGLIAVAQPLHGLASLLQEVRIWECIASNTPE